MFVILEKCFPPVGACWTVCAKMTRDEVSPARRRINKGAALGRYRVQRDALKPGRCKADADELSHKHETLSEDEGWQRQPILKSIDFLTMSFYPTGLSAFSQRRRGSAPHP